MEVAQTRWLGHIYGMDETNPTKIMYEARVRETIEKYSLTKRGKLGLEKNEIVWYSQRGSGFIERNKETSSRKSNRCSNNFYKS